MFELADKLVGIYKTHDVTQTITINPKIIWERIQETRREEINSAKQDERRESSGQPNQMAVQ